jgi:glycosyltransferase involved in cell wall biosynthesis
MATGIHPSTNPAGGGLYQYSLAMVEALCGGSDPIAPDTVVVLRKGDARPPAWTRGGNTLVLPELDGRARRLVVRTRLAALRRRRRRLDLVTPRPLIRRRLVVAGVRLMLYPAPRPLAFEVSLPYVIAVHDLLHRRYPHFPEVSAGGQWEAREHLFRNAVRRATMVLADSDAGREEILEAYGEVGLTSDRVAVLPYLPARYLTAVDERDRDAALARHGLEPGYLFYPAQFWPHKNHARVVEALARIRDRGARLVLAGGARSPIAEQTLADVRTAVERLGLGERVRFLGYVADGDMSALYAGAVALVMPTYNGPTNIPVLEAWAFGVPVVTSRLPGNTEQAGDAALLADPGSVEEIAAALERVLSDENLRRTLAERGRERLARFTPQDYRTRLAAIVAEAQERAAAED